METIGEKIYNLRKEKDVSQEELSFALNVSRQTISRWERDNSKPTESNIRCLCKFFGVDKNYFSEITVANVLTDEVTTANSNRGLIIFAVAAISVFLICCVAACCVASYVAFLPPYANGLNNAAAGRFRYIGIVCVAVGVL